MGSSRRVCYLPVSISIFSSTLSGTAYANPIERSSTAYFPSDISSGLVNPNNIEDIAATSEISIVADEASVAFTPKFSSGLSSTTLESSNIEDNIGAETVNQSTVRDSQHITEDTTVFLEPQQLSTLNSDINQTQSVRNIIAPISRESLDDESSSSQKVRGDSIDVSDIVIATDEPSIESTPKFSSEPDLVISELGNIRTNVEIEVADQSSILDSKDVTQGATDSLASQRLSALTSNISQTQSTGNIAEPTSRESLYADYTDDLASQIAQAPPSSIPDVLPDIPRIQEDNGSEEIELAPSLPELDELFSPETLSPAEDSIIPTSEEETIIIQRFEVVGSTVFSPEELEAVVSEFTGRPITFTEILRARSAITQLYIDNGYITSGAIFPPQPLKDGVARIEVIEGSLEAIEINGTQRLNDSYIRSRLDVGIAPPINSTEILERLQLLQIDPLVESISADLQAGVDPGTNRLVVSVTEADSFNVNYSVDNNRSPSVGSVRHQLQLNQANLLGLGDRLNLGYSLTAGSDDLDFAYTLPINPRDGTLAFSVSHSDSDVIEAPFESLDISSDTTLYELTLRQPLIKKPTQEFALGLTASHQDSQTFLGFDDIGPFPLSPGADSDGRTSVSAARFFQDWTKQGSNQVIALRSQFNLGLDALGSTVNDDAPDSRFFSWQGQAQWARSLGADALLLLKGSLQLTPDSLLSQEQFGIGGQSTVRGYRQNQILTDNGVLGSVEVRLPVLGSSQDGALLQATPFLDVGHGWNSGGSNPDDNTLMGVGAGLLFSTKNLSARLDWGIPVISVDSDRDSLQENGIYFSLNYSFF